MPLYLTKNNTDGSRIAIWQIKESASELFALANLSERLQIEVESFRSDPRKKEWLTLRILLKDILKLAHPDDVFYDAKGKPHLQNGNGHISFSHTGNFAAVIFHPNKNVGIDIETIHPRIENIAHKFVNEDENAFILPTKKTEMLHIIWGVKEVLYKIYGKGGVDFRKHLNVQPFSLANQGIVDAEMRIESHQTLLINYFFRDELVVVYGCQ